MNNSNIEWTHHTFNPVRGCQKVSPGCQNCYAETLSKRNPLTLGEWGPTGRRAIAAESYWQQPIKWDRAAQAAGEQHRVFCASLSDVFEDRPEWIEPRVRLFDLIRQTPHLDWLLLTKRPENILPMLGNAYCDARDAKSYETMNWLWHWENKGIAPANVWLGTSVENQETADKRIPELLQVPAVVRFLSCEPLLGPVDLTHVGWRDNGLPRSHTDFKCWWQDVLSGASYFGDQNGDVDTFINEIHWVIAGGESGPNARPMHPDWARSLRDQCVAAGVAFHFKQWGEYLPDSRQPESIPLPSREKMVALNRDGAIHTESWNRVHCQEGLVAMERVGKKAAGRLLDGRTWDELPTVEVAARCAGTEAKDDRRQPAAGD